MKSDAPGIQALEGTLVERLSGVEDRRDRPVYVLRIVAEASPTNRGPVPTLEEEITPGAFQAFPEWASRVLLERLQDFDKEIRSEGFYVQENFLERCLSRLNPFGYELDTYLEKVCAGCTSPACDMVSPEKVR